MLHRFVWKHRACIEADADGPWDAVTIVPSKADRDPHRAHTEIEHKRAVGKLVPERRCDRGRWRKQQLVDKTRGRGKLPHQ